MEQDVAIEPVMAKPAQRIRWTANGRRLIKLLSIFLIIVVGLVLRLNPLSDWAEHPELALYEGEPILTTFDGYYYLGLARDLLEGRYTAVNENRIVPDYPMRPQPVPLMSAVAAGVAGVTGWSLNWVAALLPAVLGILLALPVFAIGRFYGGAFMGLSAALLVLVSPYYVNRSSVGWFDTDCLLVTLLMTMIYCFLQFAVKETRSRYGYLAAGLTTYLLMMWWWDQTPQVVTVLASAALALATLFFYRPKASGEWWWFVAIVGVCMAVVLYWQGIGFPAGIFRSVAGNFLYISKSTGSLFPNTGASVGEQIQYPLFVVMKMTTGHPIILLLAVAGLLWLLVQKPKESLFLAIPVGLSVLALAFASRFLIYVAPVVALGIAYLATQVWRMGSHSIALTFAAPALVFAALIPGYQQILKIERFPQENPSLIDGMVAAEKLTPENAVVWAWWDHGYPMAYWSRRGTINDGQVHSGERSAYTALPLVSSSPRLSANFMQFFVARGISGVHEFYQAVGGKPEDSYELMLRILFDGPEKGRALLQSAMASFENPSKSVNEWLTFFYPEDGRPVYLYLDWRLTKIAYWWFWLGSWDIERQEGIHPFYRVALGVTSNDGVLKNRRGLVVDLEKGNAQLNNAVIPFLSFTNLEDDEQGTQFFQPGEGEEGAVVDYLPSKNLLVIAEPVIAHSVFNRLFTGQLGNNPYFEIVKDQMPAYRLLKVRGDQLAHEDLSS